ncbi:diphthamide synthesis protein [Candidatus Woesearchaeota archaeon]|nr:diphthamide synthesis protein [Candidatus Woesearchaeota archaeon]
MGNYKLETNRVIQTIKEKNAKKVCLQLPDGLKPEAKEIVDDISAATGASVFIWAGSNFGACDLPLEVQRLGVDLLVHYGHSKWVYDLETVK